MRVGILFVFAVSMVGCSMLQKRPVEAVPDAYQTALARLSEGDFQGADGAFRESASRCTSGPNGRRSLLFLALLAQDPRNPEANPDSAALMAERMLNLPDNTVDQTLEAEALYLGALGLGADPALHLDPASPGFAVRFGSCDEPFPARVSRPLPQLETKEPAVAEPQVIEDDGLAVLNQALRRDGRRLNSTIDSLRAELQSAQGELDRIRGLLRRPDTSSVRSPISS